jgi:hypothetical protein
MKRSGSSGLCARLLELAWCALLWPTALPALVSAPQVSPAQVNVAINRSARIQVRWTLNADTGPQVSSPQGVLEDATGRRYLTVPRLLSAGIASALSPAGALQAQTVRFAEGVSIPAAVLAEAIAGGVNRLFYRRTFTDGSGSSLTISLPVNITGAGAAGFAVNYIGLRFDDDSVRRLAAPRSPLRARAVIRFSGTGQLRAVWEVADPSSASGSPVFRPLRVVRRPLFGGRAVTVESPPLPTDRKGLHLVRLRVLEPAFSEAPVALE